VIKQQ
jgi:hypothetical protein